MPTLLTYIRLNTLFTLLLSLAMLLFSLAGADVESILEFNRSEIDSGECWRLFSGNLVHYGNAHLVMNLAAFLLIGLSLLHDLSAKNYILLFMFCALCVCIGVLWGNPELLFYRGFSGVLHGLIIAGLFFNRWRHPSLTWLFIGLVFAKIIYEHTPSFEENQLQAMLPVAVAVDAHMYGAFAGIFYCLFYSLRQKINYLSHKKK